MDRDRRRRTEGELAKLVTDRSLPAVQSRSFVAVDRRERAVEIVPGAPPPRRDGVLGSSRARRREHLGGRRERDVEPGRQGAEHGGRLDRIDRAVIERALEELGVPVPSVPCPGEVRHDRSDRRDVARAVPTHGAERRRHLQKPRGHEMGGKHHGPIVARSRPHEALHERLPTHHDRLVRLIRLDRSLLTPSGDRAQPSEAERSPLILRRGHGKEPLRDAVACHGSTVAVAVLHHGGHQQTLRDLEEEDPATAVEVERVLEHRRGPRRVPVGAPHGGPAGTPTGLRTPLRPGVRRARRGSDTPRSLWMSPPEHHFPPFPYGN